MEYGCSVDERTRSGVTPMMFAAKGGQISIMQWLWEHGASVLASDVAGMTVAHYAAQTDGAEAIELLFRLHMEDLVKEAGIADMIAQANANLGLSSAKESVAPASNSKPDNIVIDTPSRNGTTPLHVAACFDAKNAVDMLLKYNVIVS
jgi:ankyrin repeat protein